MPLAARPALVPLIDTVKAVVLVPCADTEKDTEEVHVLRAVCTVEAELMAEANVMLTVAEEAVLDAGPDGHVVAVEVRPTFIQPAS